MQKKSRRKFLKSAFLLPAAALIPYGICSEVIESDKQKKDCRYCGPFVWAEVPLNANLNLEAMDPWFRSEHVWPLAAIFAVTDPMDRGGKIFAGFYGLESSESTHLLHVLGNYFATNDLGSLKIITGQQFFNMSIKSIRYNRKKFIEAMTYGCDLLIIDDLNFLEHTELVQTDFEKIMDARFSLGKKMIFSFRTNPSEIKSLHPSLKDKILRNVHGSGGALVI